MCYGIYLMNNKLNIYHNDNYFSNVLIKFTLDKKISHYQIDNVKYTVEKNYRLCFYDFDLAFLNDEPNLNLNNDEWLIQNKKSAKDIWTLLNSLSINICRNNYLTKDIKYYFLYNLGIKNLGKSRVIDASTSLSYLKDNSLHPEIISIINFIKIVLDNNDEYISRFNEGIINNLYFPKEFFWNSYCENNIQDPCIIPNEPQLFPLNVLHRLLENEEILKILNFKNFDAFYIKYLKYKSKYLELKNKH